MLSMAIDPIVSTGPSALVKVHVTIVDDVIAGESLWALPLGGAQYVIKNVPFAADCCTFGDVVECVQDPVTRELEFVAVVDSVATGYWKILFAETASEDQRTSILEELEAAGGNMEEAQGAFFVMASLRPTDPAPLTAILLSHRATLWFADLFPG